MKLEIGKQYRNGHGTIIHIDGLAKTGLVNNEIVYYSRDGMWYTESGGRVYYDGKKHYVSSLPKSTWNLMD